MAMLHWNNRCNLLLETTILKSVWQYASKLSKSTRFLFSFQKIVRFKSSRDCLGFDFFFFKESWFKTVTQGKSSKKHLQQILISLQNIHFRYFDTKTSNLFLFKVLIRSIFNEKKKSLKFRHLKSTTFNRYNSWSS